MEEWHKLLETVSRDNFSLAGLLRSARPKGKRGKFLEIEVFYQFHKDQPEQSAKRKILEEAIASIWGPTNVKMVLGGDKEDSRRKENKTEALSAAEEVFGI